MSGNQSERGVSIPDEIKAVVKQLINEAVELYARPSCTGAYPVLAVDVETLRYAFDIPAPCMCGNPDDPNLSHWTGTHCFPFDDPEDA